MIEIEDWNKQDFIDFMDLMNRSKMYLGKCFDVDVGHFKFS
jgi:hypothetical protein